MLVLALATATMFAVSMRANYLYGYGIGQSEETKYAIAWANVGADLWKGFGLITVVALWRNLWRRAAIATCLTWLVCLAFSISSAIGIYVQERTAQTSGREARHASYEDRKKELTEVEHKLQTLGGYRPAAQVEALIAGVMTRQVMISDRVRGTVGSTSANCTKSDARTAKDCTQVAQFRAELAVAAEAARLEGRARELRQDVDRLRDRGGAAKPDPVGEFWVWVSRGWISVHDVGFGLPLFFALMIEMVSGFGPVGIVAYAEATRRPRSQTDMTRSVATQRVISGDDAARRDVTGWKEVGHVVQYMADCTEPTSNPAAVGSDELYAHYKGWCVSQHLHALSEQGFVKEFDRVRASPQLAGKIKKFGTRYFGIALASKTRTLPAIG